MTRRTLEPLEVVRVPETTHDCYTRLTGLSQRRRFNPAASEDIKELSYFLKNSKWKNGCPFYLEWPYNDIVSMCKTKFTEHSLAKVK